MKTKKLLALILAVAMMCSFLVVLTSCAKTYTVTYYNGDQVVKTEQVKENAKAPDAVVKANGYTSDGWYKDRDLKVPFDFKTPITADVSIYGHFNRDTFTYNYAMSVFPTNWNPHIYETNDDSEILNYVATGFYTFDYNDKKDGYKIVNDMATSAPEDVTAQYAADAKWGIEAGKAHRAWKINLRHDLKWDDGSEIKAADFIESAKLLLNPKAQNKRADSLYSSDMVVKNAQLYLKQGQKLFEKVSYLYETVAAAQAAEHVVYLDYNQVDDMGYFDYLPNFFIYTGAAGARVKTEVNFFTKYNVTKENPRIALTADMITDYSNCDEWNPDAVVELPTMSSIDYTYPAVNFADVGVQPVAGDDYSFVLILDKPLSGFYLDYSLSSTWLVKTDLYKRCEVNASGEGVYSNSYSTTAENTPSFGPYKLTFFQKDKEFKLTKNTHWYGYNDAANKNLYQTTDVVVKFVDTAATRLQMLNSGELDTYGLTIDDMKDYSKSDACYYTTGESTFFMAFNPNLTALKAEEAKTAGTDKEILTVKEFRQAMSFAMDRAKFCLATSPTNNAAFGIFSSIIISDPELGIAYRTTEEAKKVLVKFWGLEDSIGAGKPYATIDEAIESITGYNLTKAKNLFNVAYDKAVAAGYMSATDVVEIKVGTPNATSKFYNNGYEFIKNNYTEAVKGTKLEGKLRFTIDNTLGNGFGTALRTNKVDMLFGVGWNGSALNPYNLMEAYTKSDYQYNPSWDTSKESLTLTIDGEALTASVFDWTKAMTGTPTVFTKADGKTVTKEFGSSSHTYAQRMPILAALENAVLNTYDLIPLMDDASASLKGKKIKYYTEDYIYGVGRGGIKYMSYNYTDVEWDAYVKSQGGKLNYK